MTHKHWTIVAYEKQEGQSFLEAVEITLLNAVTEKDALGQASRVIKRPFYRVHRVSECSSCDFKKEVTDFIKGQTQEQDE